MAKKERKVAVKEVEEKQEEMVTIQCAVTVGITERGEIFFNIHGVDQNLIMVEGLLEYAKRHMDEIWKERFAKRAEALAAAEEE